MQFFAELCLDQNMSGTSTGTTWLANKNTKSIHACCPADGGTFTQINKVYLDKCLKEGPGNRVQMPGKHICADRR